MSALGHYLEEEGIATVVIALIRPQAENTRPPRALWVPFELGRPIGPPGDAAFQKRVILAALGMLVEGGGPVRIIDFPDDDRRARPDPAWQRPFMPAALANGDAESLASRLEAEILVLRHQLNVLRRKAPKQLAFRSIDRLVFAGLYRLVPGVLEALKILKPCTVIRWHRAGFRVYWRWKSRARGGRPKTPVPTGNLIGLANSRESGDARSR